MEIKEKNIKIVPTYSTRYTYILVRIMGGKKCPFFGKCGLLCFLETPVLRFALLPYYRRPVGYSLRILEI